MMKRFLLNCTAAIVALGILGDPANAQQERNLTQRDLVILDKFINSSELNVYLAKNGDVDHRARSCNKLHPTTKGIGNYETKDSVVTVGVDNLVVYTGNEKRDVKKQYVPGNWNRCVRSKKATSVEPRIFSEENIPLAVYYKLNHDFCYLEAVYTDCTTRCAAKASAGSMFHYLVVGEEIAESISKTSCLQ